MKTHPQNGSGDAGARTAYQTASMAGEPCDGDDHALVMEGEVGSVAQKLALQLARSIPDVGNVVSHLHVAPIEPKGDSEIWKRSRPSCSTWAN